MGLIRFVSDLITYPLHYPWWWLLFSWVIWLVLKWRNWVRPTLLIMLLYSIAVGIFYIKSWQSLLACMRIELCAPTFSIFPFIAAVSFWMVVLYFPITGTLQSGAISQQVRKSWWIVLPVVVLAIWHISLVSAGIIRSLQDSNLIASEILFYPVMTILVAWLLWFLLPIFHLPTPTLPTMFLYSISVANASTRLWVNAIVCTLVAYDCETIFSFPLFLAEIIIWFIALFVLMKLTLTIVRQVPGG